MKIGSLISILRSGLPLTRDTALICSSANVTAPGLGTLIAGRKLTGACQLLFSLTGLFLTLVFGGKFLMWSSANWARLHQPQEDMSALLEMFAQARWALLGIFLFGLSWIWGALSSYLLMRRFPKNPPPRVPPRIPA